mmetsp:Transcript_107095/g.308121  ORF Transcript_107095/g.308121 Transcript_107095/m.308121 type:complete len:319 (-) Transcript_107095:788-1744(-)
MKISVRSKRTSPGGLPPFLHRLRRLVCRRLGSRGAGGGWRVPFDESGDVELPLAAGVIHEADFAEDRALGPAHVVYPANAPHAAHIAVRVPAVELVAVVEPDRLGQRLLRARRPLEYLLRPVHPQETVHLALTHHLQLGRVPQIIVGLPGLQLRGCVQVLPLVAGVVLQGQLRPVRGALDGVVLFVIETEIVGQLPADNGLFDVRGDALLEGLLRLAGLPDTQRAPLCGELAEVYVGREAGASVDIGIVSLVREKRQALADKLLQADLARFAARRDARHRPHRSVHLQRLLGRRPINLRRPSLLLRGMRMLLRWRYRL